MSVPWYFIIRIRAIHMLLYNFFVFTRIIGRMSFAFPGFNTSGACVGFTIGDAVKDAVGKSVVSGSRVGGEVGACGCAVGTGVPDGFAVTGSVGYGMGETVSPGICVLAGSSVGKIPGAWDGCGTEVFSALRVGVGCAVAVAAGDNVGVDPDKSALISILQILDKSTP